MYLYIWHMTLNDKGLSVNKSPPSPSRDSDSRSSSSVSSPSRCRSSSPSSPPSWAGSGWSSPLPGCGCGSGVPDWRRSWGWRRRRRLSGRRGSARRVAGSSPASGRWTRGGARLLNVKSDGCRWRDEAWKYGHLQFLHKESMF